MPETRKFRCFSCGHVWEEPYGSGRPQSCPACGGAEIRRTDKEAGTGPGRGRRAYGNGRRASASRER